MTGGPTANISWSSFVCPSFRPRPSGRAEEPAVLTWAAMPGKSRFLHSGLTPSGRNDNDKGMAGGPTASISMSVTSCPSFRPRPSGRAEEPAVLTWAAMPGKSRFLHSGLTPSGRNDNDKGMAGGPTANISMSVISMSVIPTKAFRDCVATGVKSWSWRAVSVSPCFAGLGAQPSGGTAIFSLAAPYASVSSSRRYWPG